MNKQYLSGFTAILIAILIIAPGIAGADSKTLVLSQVYTRMLLPVMLTKYSNKEMYSFWTFVLRQNITILILQEQN